MPKMGCGLNMGLAHVVAEHQNQEGEKERGREGRGHESPKQAPLYEVRSWPNWAP